MTEVESPLGTREAGSSRSWLVFRLSYSALRQQTCIPLRQTPSRRLHPPLSSQSLFPQHRGASHHHSHCTGTGQIFFSSSIQMRNSFASRSHHRRCFVCRNRSVVFSTSGCATTRIGRQWYVHHAAGKPEPRVRSEKRVSCLKTDCEADGAGRCRMNRRYQQRSKIAQFRSGWEQCSLDEALAVGYSQKARVCAPSYWSERATRRSACRRLRIPDIRSVRNCSTNLCVWQVKVYSMLLERQHPWKRVPRVFCKQAGGMGAVPKIQRQYHPRLVQM